MKGIKVLASSGSLEGLTKLTSEYFMGSTITLKESGEVFNAKGVILSVRWRLHNERFKLIQI